MIAKISIGAGFRGVLDYAFDVGKKSAKDAKLINSNMLGNTPQELSKEFGAVRKFRPTLGKTVMHVAFSAAHEDAEKMTDEMFINIANDYMAEMGFDDNQFVLVRHNDTDHEHCHLVVNRIKIADGSVVSDKNEKRRALKVMRKVEEKYDLRKISSDKPAKKYPKRGELEMMKRTGEPSQRMKLMQRLDAALSTADSFSTYCELLKGSGVQVKVTLQNDKTKVSGVSYGVEDFYFKASDLGQDYMMKNLAKNGLGYDKQKHLTIIQELGFDNDDEQTGGSESANQRQAGAGHEGSNGSPENQTVPNSRGNGGSPDAAGAGHVRLNGELEREDSARANAESKANPAVRYDGSTKPNAARTLGGNATRGATNAKPAKRADESSTGEQDPVSVDTSGNEPSDNYHTYALLNLSNVRAKHTDERSAQTNLAGNSQQRAKRPSIKEWNEGSLQETKKQLEALGCKEFVIGIGDDTEKVPSDKRFVNEETPIETYFDFLKTINARGKHIYVKPEGDHGLVFLDDVTAEAIAEMNETGFEPAVSIETSPDNFQVWIKLSDEPLSKEIRVAATKKLARKFNADPASADADHFGRLAGFTNCKAKYEDNGKHPLVKLKSAAGKLASMAKEFLEELFTFLKKMMGMATRVANTQQKAGFKKGRLEAIAKYRAQFSSSNPKDEYLNQAQSIIKKYGDETDYSRMDFMVTKSMIDKGFSHTQIAEAMETSSPNVEDRKAGHLDDYIQRTIRAAQAEYDIEKAEANADYEKKYGNNSEGLDYDY